MSRQVVFTRRARADVIEAAQWIAERSPEAADRWHAGLVKAIDSLRSRPEGHPIAEEKSEALGVEIRQML